MKILEHLYHQLIPPLTPAHIHYVLCDYHEAFWTHLIESRSNHYLSVKVCLRAEDDPQGPQGPSSPRQDREGQPGAPLGPPGQVQSTRTRHSPPVSRPNSEYDHHLEVKNYIFSLLLLKKNVLLSLLLVIIKRILCTV